MVQGRNRGQADIRIMNSVGQVKKWQDWENIPGSRKSVCKVLKVRKKV